MSTLDEAWAAVEAALPEGWDFGITMTSDRLYRASAAPLASSVSYYTWADSPAAALEALAAKLREDPR